MEKKTKRATIKIDGAKLRSLLESSTGKTIRQLAYESGFSKNLIAEACRTGYASAVVQNVAKLYGINPEAYIIKEPEIIETTEAPLNGQISIDDLGAINRAELKELFKEAILELANDCVISYDARSMRYTITVNKEAMVCKRA